VSLQASLDQVAKGPREDADAAVTQALGDASQAKLATKQLANQFRLDEGGKVHLLVQRLMEAPILYVESALQTVGPAQLNGKGNAFCAPFRQLLAKFPFNSYGTVAATVDEVNALLQPGAGTLWTFVQDDLANYVTRQGTQFAEKPGTSVRISPTFLTFLNRAAEFSGALYRAEGGSPSLIFSLRPILSDAVPGLTVTVDGRPARFTRTSAAAKRISWSAEEAQEAGLSALVGGREQEVLFYQGTWSLFKLFHQAEWFSREGAHALEWKLPPRGGNAPQRVTFDIQLAGARPILKRDFFSGVSCGGRVTR
jgi:type VI protein secretion system component VasK